MRCGMLSDLNVQQNGPGETQAYLKTYPTGTGRLHQSLSFGQWNLACFGTRHASLNGVRYFHSSVFIVLYFCKRKSNVSRAFGCF